MVVRSSPVAGSALGVEPAWDSLTPYAPPHPAQVHTCALTLSLSLKKQKKENVYEISDNAYSSSCLILRIQ